MTRTYQVSWAMEIEAENCIEAAQVAHGILNDPTNIATIFGVSPVDDPNAEETYVDVNADGFNTAQIVHGGTT